MSTAGLPTPSPEPVCIQGLESSDVSTTEALVHLRYERAVDRSLPAIEQALRMSPRPTSKQGSSPMHLPVMQNLCDGPFWRWLYPQASASAVFLPSNANRFAVKPMNFTGDKALQVHNAIWKENALYPTLLVWTNTSFHCLSAGAQRHGLVKAITAADYRRSMVGEVGQVASGISLIAAMFATGATLPYAVVQRVCTGRVTRANKAILGTGVAVWLVNCAWYRHADRVGECVADSMADRKGRDGRRDNARGALELAEAQASSLDRLALRWPRTVGWFNKVLACAVSGEVDAATRIEKYESILCHNTDPDA